LSLAELVTELVAIEQRVWSADLSRLPAGCDVDVLAEAVTVLVLLPAAGIEKAAELLCRVPQFAHDAAQESRSRWPAGPAAATRQARTTV
jgi:hypothetical protein